MVMNVMSARELWLAGVFVLWTPRSIAGRRDEAEVVVVRRETVPSERDGRSWMGEKPRAANVVASRHNVECFMNENEYEAIFVVALWKRARARIQHTRLLAFWFEWPHINKLTLISQVISEYVPSSISRYIGCVSYIVVFVPFGGIEAGRK